MNVLNQVSPSRSGLRALSGIVLLGTIALSGCATTSPKYHDYVMQGQVLSVDGDTITVCVGERDGAKVGQVLDLVQHVKILGSPKMPGAPFRRESIGSVRITGLMDEHYATAQVLSGVAEVNNTVELKQE